MTRAEIEAHQSKMYVNTATVTVNAPAAGGPAAARSVVNDLDETPIEENVNRMIVEGLEARSVDEAIKLLRYV